LVDEFIEKAVEYNMNGRQIKNIVRMAYALVKDMKCTMGFDDISLIARLVKLSEADLDTQSAEKSR
jgi:hypothetical protein